MHSDLNSDNDKENGTVNSPVWYSVFRMKAETKKMPPLVSSVVLRGKELHTRQEKIISEFRTPPQKKKILINHKDSATGEGYDLP